MKLSFEDLLNVKVSSASKKKESLNDAPAVISVITKDQINQYGANNLIEVFDRTTNLYALSTFNANGVLVLRGKQSGNSPISILLLLDGRPLRVSLDGAFNDVILQTIPLSIIEKIEIIRGPGSVLYGSNAYVGVINIITKNIKADKISAKINYGSFNSSQASISFHKKTNDLSILLGVRGIYSDGWTFTARGESDVIRNQQNTQDSLFLAPTTIQKEQQAISSFLKLNYKNFSNNSFFASHDIATINVNPNWRNDAAKNSFKIRNHRFFNDLNYSNNITKQWKITINNTINYQNCVFHSNDLMNNIQKSTSLDYLFEITNQFTLSKNINLVIGALTNHQSGYIEQYNFNSQAQQIDIEKKINNDPWIALPNYNYANHSAYTQIDIQTIKSLKLVGGLQINKNHLLKVDVVPRLGLVFNPIKQLNFKILYGEAFRSPTALEKGVRFVNSLSGTLDLLPEKIKTLDVNVSYTNHLFSTNFTYFNSHETNAIIRVTEPDTIVYDNFSMIFPSCYDNFGEVTTHGVELESTVNIFDKLKILKSVSYYQTINNKNQINFGGLPTLMIKVGIVHKINKKVTIGLFNSYFTKYGNFFLYDEQGYLQTKIGNPSEKSFHYTTLNISCQLHKYFLFLPTSKLSLYISNLLNEEINDPEVNRRIINTLPARAPRAININYLMSF